MNNAVITTTICLLLIGFGVMLRIAIRHDKKLMEKRPRLFVLLHIRGEVYDYPRIMPIPQIGETIIWNGVSAIVKDVRHSSTINIHEVKIIAT